jgi:hypothetical protein
LSLTSQKEGEEDFDQPHLFFFGFSLQDIFTIGGHMIHIRGDIHGEDSQFCEAVIPGEAGWNENDILIIAGDFGCVFQGEDRYLSERNKLNSLAKKPYRILFADGNH